MQALLCSIPELNLSSQLPSGLEPPAHVYTPFPLRQLSPEPKPISLCHPWSQGTCALSYGHCSLTSGPSYSGHPSASFSAAPTQLLTSHQPHCRPAGPLLRAPTSTSYSLLYCRLSLQPLLDMLSPQHSDPLILGGTAAPDFHLCCSVICLAWPQTLKMSPRWARVDREIEKAPWSQPGGEQGLLYA